MILKKQTQKNKRFQRDFLRLACEKTMQQALDTLSVSISQLIHLGDIFRMGIPQKLRRNNFGLKVY